MTEEEFERYEELGKKKEFTDEEFIEYNDLEDNLLEGVKETFRKWFRRRAGFVIAGTLAGAIVISKGSFSDVKLDLADRKKRIENADYAKQGKELAEQKKNYSKDFIEEGKEECPLAIHTILENHFTVIYSRLDGYCVIGEDGLFRWVSLDGNIYTNMEDFVGDDVRAVPYEEIKESFRSLPIDASYDAYTVKASVVNKDGVEVLLQPIYKDGEFVGKAEYIEKNGLVMDLYMDHDQKIFAGSLGEFSTLNEYKDLVVYSETMQKEKNESSVDGEKAKQSIDTEGISVEMNDTFHFATFYQHAFPLEEANSHAYVTPEHVEQKKTIYEKGLYILDEVSNEGLLCLTPENEVVYCAANGKVYTNYVNFLTQDGILLSSLKNLSAIKQVDMPKGSYGPYNVEVFEENTGISAYVVNALTRQTAGKVSCLEVLETEYLVYQDIERLSYASSLPDLALRKEIEEYKETGILPDIPEYPELSSFKER